MGSTKRKAQNVYDKAEWHHRLDEKDKVLAKDVFELWMAGLIDLDLCIRVEQAILKGVQLLTPFGHQTLQPAK